MRAAGTINNSSDSRMEVSSSTTKTAGLFSGADGVLDSRYGWNAGIIRFLQAEDFQTGVRSAVVTA